MHMPRIVISQTLYCLDLPGIGRPGSAGGVRGSASPPTKEDETRAPGYSGPKAMERGSYAFSIRLRGDASTATTPVPEPRITVCTGDGGCEGLDEAAVQSCIRLESGQCAALCAVRPAPRRCRDDPIIRHTR